MNLRPALYLTLISLSLAFGWWLAPKPSHYALIGCEAGARETEGLSDELRQSILKFCSLEFGP